MKKNTYFVTLYMVLIILFTSYRGTIIVENGIFKMI
jgi:hypothetical protein